MEEDQLMTQFFTNFYNIIFFSILTIMILALLNSLLYIILEIPMKKLNKLIFEKDNNSDDVFETNFTESDEKSINKKNSE
jgi:hypothetical protein